MSRLRGTNLSWWGVTLGVPVLGLALIYELHSARTNAMDPQDAAPHLAPGVIWATTGDGGRRGTAP